MDQMEIKNDQEKPVKWVVKIKRALQNYLTDGRGIIDPQDEFQLDLIVGFFVIIIAVVIVVLMDILIGHFVQNTLDTNFILNNFRLLLTNFRPEQAERVQFLASIVVFPILCLGLYPAVRRWTIKHKPINKYGFLIIALLSFFGIVGFIFFLLKTTGSFYVRSMGFKHNLPLLMISFTILLFFLILFTKYRSYKWVRIFYKIASVIACFLVLATVFISSVNTQFNAYGHTASFTAYFSSVAKVFAGEHLLIDFNSQYGNYAFFLVPLFKVIGLGVLQFTVVMGILLVGFYFILFFILNDIIKNKILLLLSYFVVPGVYFWVVHLGSYYEPYFQFWPHRVIFPGLLLLIIWGFLKANDVKKKYIKGLAILVCSLALNWNLETGVIVLGTWVLFIIWDAFYTIDSIGVKKVFKKVGFIIAEAILTIALAGIILITVTYLYSGNVPDLSSFFSYQNTFYSLGFYMLPMPLLHPWNVVALVYAVGLYVSIIVLFKKHADPNSAFSKEQKKRRGIIFAISILAIGMFSFYQGRSHNLNLQFVFWSTFFLLIIFADDLWIYLTSQAVLNKKNISQNWPSFLIASVFFLLMFGALFVYGFGTRNAYPKAVERINSEYSLLKEIENGGSNDYSENILFIINHSSPGEQVLILDREVEVYQIDSKTVDPLIMTSLVELTLNKDYKKILDYLNI
jgi:hypothetical protein